MNLNHQVAAHTKMMCDRWKHLDPKEVAKKVKIDLLSGDAWLIHEPRQLEMF